MKHLFRDGGPKIDAFIAIDGTSNTRVLNHAIGSHRYRVRFLGPGGHSWGAFGLGNPAHAMARAIKLFDDRAGEYVTAGAKTTYNIGRIGGGNSVNSIPFENWMEVDMRSMEPGRLEEIDAIFQAAMTEALAEQNELRRDGEELTVDIEMIGDRPSGMVATDTPLIQRALAATRAVGAEPELSMGSTDSNVPICARHSGHHDRQRGRGVRRPFAPRVVGQPGRAPGHPEGAAARARRGRFRGRQLGEAVVSACQFDFSLRAEISSLLEGAAGRFRPFRRHGPW